jgi:REP element-mobilizing transposase RayT
MYGHDRRSLRLNGYDYAQAGAYFVTICTQDRACLLGDIVDGEMQLNAAGSEVQAVWNELPRRFAHLELDAFVVMPNHIHGIIVIRGRGESCIRPDDCQQQDSGDQKDRPYGTNHVHGIATFVGAGLALPEEKGAASSAPTLADVVRAFKSLSAIRVNRLIMRSGPLWQRNYYEHVVRNERELDKIREYVATNPLKWALDRENPQRTGRSAEEDTVFDLNQRQPP